MINRILLIGVCVAIVIGLVFFLQPAGRNPLKLTQNRASAKELGYLPTVLFPPLRPIKNPTIVDAADVGDSVHDDDLVLGAVVNGKARAYPINMLFGPTREVINDTLGTHAIAATW